LIAEKIKQHDSITDISPDFIAPKQLMVFQNVRENPRKEGSYFCFFGLKATFS